MEWHADWALNTTKIDQMLFKFEPYSFYIIFTAVISSHREPDKERCSVTYFPEHRIRTPKEKGLPTQHLNEIKLDELYVFQICIFRNRWYTK